MSTFLLRAVRWLVMRVGAKYGVRVETDVSQDLGMKHFYTVDISASQPI